MYVHQSFAQTTSIDIIALITSVCYYVCRITVVLFSAVHTQLRSLRAMHGVDMTDNDACTVIVSVCFRSSAWSLLDAIRMSASSKSLQQIWQQLLRSKPCSSWLFQAVADTVYSKSPVERRLCIKAVLWLLRAVPSVATAEGVAAAMLTQPALPKEIAIQLCRSGVHFSYTELAAAARNRVCGVEVWIAAQRASRSAVCMHASVKADIPAYAVEICRGGIGEVGAYDWPAAAEGVLVVLASRPALAPAECSYACARADSNTSSAEAGGYRRLHHPPMAWQAASLQHSCGSRRRQQLWFKG